MQNYYSCYVKQKQQKSLSLFFSIDREGMEIIDAKTANIETKTNMRKQSFHPANDENKRNWSIEHHFKAGATPF